MPPKTPTGGTRKTTVRGHTRTSASGKVIKVSRHSRTIGQWKEAAVAWSSTGASGTLAIASLIELGFTLVSTICLVLTVLLAAWSVKATTKVARKRRGARKTASASAFRTKSRTRTRRR
jgi:hypothetical protein